MSEKLQSITPKLVEQMPAEEDMDEGILYISEKYSTAIHFCCCGCGLKVVTPISRQDWTLTLTDFVDKDQEASLNPSIGNWQYPCRSHYFITKNKVVWH